MAYRRFLWRPAGTDGLRGFPEPPPRGACRVGAYPFPRRERAGAASPIRNLEAEIGEALLADLPEPPIPGRLVRAGCGSSSFHRSHVVTIRDDSYRLREKRRSGLLKTGSLDGPQGKTTARPAPGASGQVGHRSDDRGSSHRRQGRSVLCVGCQTARGHRAPTRHRVDAGPVVPQNRNCGDEALSTAALGSHRQMSRISSEVAATSVPTSSWALSCIASATISTSRLSGPTAE